MKLKPISASVAIACGVVAAPALAITANNYANTGEFAGSTMNIRVSGSTVQDRQFLLAALTRFCQAGSLHRYSVTDNTVYFCNTNTNTALLAPRAGTTKLAFYKYSVGGSSSGIAPVNLATPIPFLDLSKINALCAGTSAIVDIDGTGPAPTFVDVNCNTAAALTTNAASYMGVSDLEPAFFEIRAANRNNLESGALATVPVGAPVTKALYEALQARQGLNVGGLSAADRPTLSRAQLTSIYTQQGQAWATVLGGGSPLLGPTSDDVYVVRRVDTSSTQKVFEALVARTGNSSLGSKSCQDNVDPFVADPGVAVITDNATSDAACASFSAASSVITASGSTQVTRCLEGHQSKGRAAIGMLTMDTAETAGSLWRFVKVNRIEPTRANIISGEYTDYFDVSLNTRVGTNNPTLAAPGYTAFLSALNAAFANPTFNPGTQQPFGLSGTMTLDSLTNPPPTPSPNSNPWSRLVAATTLNNCQAGKLWAN
jgi:hypothetical protein